MNTQTGQTVQPLQPVGTHYSVPIDYLIIAVVFMAFGYYLAYKTAVNMAKSISFITNQKI